MKTNEHKAVGHTAGEWVNSNGRIHAADRTVAWVDFWDDTRCAGKKPVEEQEANARLIACAPEMLEALEIALAYMERDADDEQEREDYATITAIIARAKGEA